MTKCGKCGREISQSEKAFDITSIETGSNVIVCQSCLLERYGGNTAKPIGDRDLSSNPEPIGAGGRVCRKWIAHEFYVTGLVLCDSGRRVVTSADGFREPQDLIKSWDLATGDYINSFACQYPSDVRALCVSPDGRFILAGKSSNMMLFKAKARSGDAVGEFGHLGPTSERARDISSVGFSPDSATVVTGGDDGRVRTWNLSGDQIRELHAYESKIVAVGFHRNGYEVLFAGGSQLAVWDSRTRDVVRRVARLPGTVWSLAVSPCGELVAARHGGGVSLLRYKTG